jgi:hypothetical protein
VRVSALAWLQLVQMGQSRAYLSGCDVLLWEVGCDSRETKYYIITLLLPDSILVDATPYQKHSITKVIMINLSTTSFSRRLSIFCVLPPSFCGSCAVSVLCMSSLISAELHRIEQGPLIA